MITIDSQCLSYIEIICVTTITAFINSLYWGHNGCDGVSNQQPQDCLLNRLFRRRSKKTSKLRVTGLCVGNSPVADEFSHKWPVTRKMFPFNDVIMFPVAGSCYKDGDPMSYTGTLFVSIYNDPCEDWTLIHEQNFVDADFPDGSVAAASIFCRNADNFSAGPWCYVDFRDVALCDVSWCSSVGWC